MQNQTVQMSVKQLANRFVGQVSGFQITEANVAAHGATIAQAYRDHKVLVFRNQDISVRDFSAFGTIFGRAEEHHVLAMRHPEISTLTVLSNQSETGRNPVMKYFGDGWHADSSYKAIPANATMLLGTQIPEGGGDTLFANVEAAFEDLPESTKTELRQLRVRHQYRWSPNQDDPWARWKFVGEAERRSTPEVIHPLVRLHPETGKVTLHIAPRIIGSVIGVEGMDWDSSNALIDELMGHITSEQYVYRHKWNPRDVVVWDNRCLLHSATTKKLPENQVRRLIRITTTGTPVVASSAHAGITRIVADPEFA